MSKSKGSKAFCRMIKKQIPDEIHAKKAYDTIKKQAPTKSIKEAIDRIGAQEGKHRGKLERIYRLHCR